MKVVVTGGAGFIGSHLVDACMERGDAVVAVDNLSVGRRANLERWQDHPNFSFVAADVAGITGDEPWWAGTERIFHLAARADIVPSIQMPVIYHRANVDGTVAVLEAARRHAIKRFVYAASSSCYGLAETFPTPETAPIAPRYPYALTKYLGEECVRHWGQVYGLPVMSVRFFNVYGPRARTSGTYGAVFGVFLAQKLNGLPFTVVGDGTQTRDFTFVTDAVAALLAAADSDLAGEVFNVGSGGTYSINSLIQLLGGEAVYIPKRPGEPDCTFADITRIRAKLGWRPRVSFEQGVGILLEHLEDFREAPVWTPAAIAEATKDWFKFLGAQT